jgi:hypothetical protein
VRTQSNAGTRSTEGEHCMATSGCSISINRTWTHGILQADRARVSGSVVGEYSSTPVRGRHRTPYLRAGRTSSGLSAGLRALDLIPPHGDHRPDIQHDMVTR